MNPDRPTNGQAGPATTGNQTATIAGSGRAFRPRVDVAEHEDRYVLLADVPGARPGDVDVRFEDGVLTIHAPVAPRRAPSAADEYAVGDWRLDFRFDDLVDPEAIEARQSRGVLEVTLRKAARQQARRIDVRAN